jgi:CDP-diacylglycerol--glycerol-3-phosphate 3-phosphatidyltransferase
LPNLISCFRIVLSLALLLLVDKPVLFVIVYLLCGFSDIADGYLARRLGAETAFGAKLDSLGDFTFYAVCLFLLITSANIVNHNLIIVSVIVIATIRAVNLIITKVKFNEWSVMHTTGNKFTGFVLFTMLPIYIFVSNIPRGIIIAVCAVAALSATEESFILLKSKKYNANRRNSLLQKEKKS